MGSRRGINSKRFIDGRVRMSAIELAIVSGLIAFLAKIGFDIRIEHQARRAVAVAAALAGEMRAYPRLSQPEKTASGIKVIASLTF